MRSDNAGRERTTVDRVPVRVRSDASPGGPVYRPRGTRGHGATRKATGAASVVGTAGIPGQARSADGLVAGTREALRARRDRRDTYRRLSAIIEASIDPIIITDGSGQVVLFNRAAEPLVRCPAAEAIGRPIHRLPPERPVNRSPTESALGRGADGAGVARGKPGRLQATRANGEPCPALATITPLAGDGAEQTRVVRDLTDWQWTAERLLPLSQALDETETGICITDLRGVIEYVNAAFERMVGYRRGEMVGRTPNLFRSGHHEETFYRRLWDTLLAGASFRHVFVNRNGRGELVHLDETITPLKGTDDRVTGFVVIARDITAQVRTEEALRRLIENREDQARSLAQTLHDEAGQYLTATHLALAEAGQGLSPQERTRLQGVKQHLVRVEEQLRRLSHELHPRILEDVGLVGAIEFLTEGMRIRRGISVGVTAALEGRLPPIVETTIYRVVQEALTNVSKHSHATRATIRIAQDSRGLSCSIKDDGIGFDLSSALAAGAAGGLGLKGMRDRLEALGGTLTIDSGRGRGTELRFSIPAES